MKKSKTCSLDAAVAACYRGCSFSRSKVVEDTLTIPLTPELRTAVDRLTKAEGLSPEGLVQRALQEFVFVHQFRSLREQLLQKAQARYTDDDI